MIFFADSADTWKSQCGRYEIAALPDGKARVSVADGPLGAVVAGTGPLGLALAFCQERERIAGRV